MLAADDFYDVLAAKERQLEDEWRAEHGMETEPTLTRSEELRERYLQKAVSVRTFHAETSLHALLVPFCRYGGEGRACTWGCT